VLTFEYLEETEDVFDLTVEDNHNFFADGILVHNCVEATLNPFQFCNLTELNVDDVESQEDFNERAKAAAFIGTLQAGYTDFHYLRSIWKETTEKEALLGVGMTGIASGKVLKLNMSEAATAVVDENRRVAELININPAARTTLTKPSGTSSIVVGSASGVHAWHSEYYIRRVRVGKNESLYKYMLENFPNHIEDCKFKPHLEAVMSFPQKAPEGAIMRNESAVHLLNRVRKISREWILPGHNSGKQRHNVSCTISIKSKEWEQVGKWMWDNRNDYNGIAVLPYDGGNYVQSPFEDCTKEVYEEMMKDLHEIDLSKVTEVSDNTSHTMEAACAGGACEVK
jgi:ribonucleoside-diphosphate reductase alpha chain